MELTFKIPTEKDCGKWFVAYPTDHKGGVYCGIVEMYTPSPKQEKRLTVHGHPNCGGKKILDVEDATEFGYQFIEIPPPKNAERILRGRIF